MFKTWFHGINEASYATNGLVFDTIEDATNYGHDLLSRWYGADKFAVLPAEGFTGSVSNEIAVTAALATG